MWGSDSYGNWTTSDFGEISSFINGFKNSLSSSNLNNDITSLSSHHIMRIKVTTILKRKSRKRSRNLLFLVINSKLARLEKR